MRRPSLPSLFRSTAPWVRAAVVCALSAAPSWPAHAAPPPIAWNAPSRPCWDEAAAYESVDPWLLYAIAEVESGYNPNAVHVNDDGTRDVGLMQINSSWRGMLRAYHIHRAALRNACASTYIGAWILRQNIDRYGYTWKAIAAYNTGSVSTPQQRYQGYRYASKVYAAYAMLTGTTVTAAVGVRGR